MHSAEDEVASDEEQERIEEEKETFTSSVKMAEGEAPKHVTAMVICMPWIAESSTKIVFDSQLLDLISVEHSKGEYKESLKVSWAKESNLLIVQSGEGFKS